MAAHTALCSVMDDPTNRIPAIFERVQHSSVPNHRKNCVALQKLHTRAVHVPKQMDRSKTHHVGDSRFSTIFIDMVNRVLLVKKGSTGADRVVKFIGAYARFLSEKSLELVTTQQRARGVAVSEQSEEEGSPQSRFISCLLLYLVNGFEAKDKTVRTRVVHITAELVSHLGALDEDVYEALRNGLMERARDKESIIRSHAVVALSKLLGGEDQEEREPGILDILLDSMCYDSSADVRRFALLNTPLTPATLPYILTRTRDVDASVRALLYAVVLTPSIPTTAPCCYATRQLLHNSTRLSHPRQLTICQRERVVKDGLGDREEKVRATTEKMLGAWFDQTAGKTIVKGEEENCMAVLVAFVELFDVVNEEATPIVAQALTSLFVMRPKLLGSVTFRDEFWRSLTPESVLLARAYIEHVATRDNAAGQLEAANLPVITAFAFYVQEVCNAMIDAMERLEEALFAATDADKDANIDELDAQLVDRTFVLGEVLKISMNLDYTDELGRQKMSRVVRDMLTHELLPESLMDPCLDVLKATTTDEKEIIRIVVEVINELRDSVVQQDILSDDVPAGEDIVNLSQGSINSRSSRRSKPITEMSAEERARSDETDVRSLSLCIAMLKRANGTLEENSTLEGVLADLIVPAVKRKELPLRERGLLALGLCCLIAKDLAISSFQLFLNQVQTAPETLKVKVIQVVFDILMVHEDFLCRSGDITERVITFLLQTLETEESKVVQAILCIGISKLMLNGLVTDERVLTSLILAYVSPATADNQELRQCLSCFLPIYSYSSFLNQDRLRSIFFTAYDFVAAVYDERDEDQDMISPLQFSTLFIDWTNPQKLALLPGVESKDTHVDFAIDLLKALYTKDRTDSDKHVFCRLLAKLYIPDHLDHAGLASIDVLLHHVDDRILEHDPTIQKVFNRFSSRFRKQFSRKLRQMDRSAVVESKQYRNVCELVGLEPSDDEPSHVLPGYQSDSENDIAATNASVKDVHQTLFSPQGPREIVPSGLRAVAKRPRSPANPDASSPAHKRVYNHKNPRSYGKEPSLQDMRGQPAKKLRSRSRHKSESGASSGSDDGANEEDQHVSSTHAN